jgi:hypothetical protein
VAESVAKRIIQRFFGLIGYKIVQLKAYELRTGGVSQKHPTISKVFGIGYNKTASTTLEAIFRHHGFHVPKQLDQERILSGLPFSGDYALLRDFVSEYDAFQDFPFSQFDTYIACDVLFPASKFILTIRDADEWFRSYSRYYRKAFGFEENEVLTEESFLNKDLYLFPNYMHGLMRQTVMTVQDNQARPDWTLVFDPDYFKALYRARNDRIVKYFSNRPHDLLVIDLTQEIDTKRITEFLLLPKASIIPIPHLNSN